MSYSENWYADRMIQQRLSIQLWREPESPDASPKSVLKLPLVNYNLSRRFDAVEYFISVTVPGRDPRFYARDYITSPARLRAAVLETQDAIEKVFRERVKSGMVTRVTDHERLAPVPQTEDLPEPLELRPAVFNAPIPDNYALNEEQKQKLLEQMAAELEERRQLFREDAESIHAAIERAFPLAKALGYLDKPPPSSAGSSGS
jgi:hypothetical protein